MPSADPEKPDESQEFELLSLPLGGDSGGQEAVPVDALDSARYRLRASPGLLLGMAAGDVFCLAANETGFEVLERAGNLCIQIFTRESPGPIAELAAQLFAPLGGYLDGGHTSASGASVVVMPVPLPADGFGSVEAAVEQLLEQYPAAEWYFANVYDPHDGETPLNWW